MHKPWHTLVFATVLFSVLGILSVIFPAGGIRLYGDLSVAYPSTRELFPATTTNKTEIVEAIAAVNDIDTSFVLPDTTSPLSEPPQEAPKKKLLTSLQFNSPAVMEKFFRALNGLKKDASLIRVLHYGDSQIEADRITDYLRLKLQGQFGGAGPGLISLMPLTQSVINKVNNSPGWDRFTVFMAKDKRVNHNNYGVMGSFARFAPYRKITDTTTALSEEVEIVTTKFGGTNAMEYQKLRLFYGGAQKKTWCEFYDGPALIAADSLDAGGFFSVKEFEVGHGSLTHSFRFTGLDSPDFYGVSLESDQGIMIDNISMRGSSGTFFHHLNTEQMKKFYSFLNVKLIILQFGGNAVPSIKDSLMALNYGNYIRHQISRVKKMAPDASILFVGPSDMSVKDGTEYVTYPHLEVVRDAIKKVVLESNCAFFDLYDCMGGRNSMPVWVEEKLAARDYIHFSPQGARKMATLLYAAIMNEYTNFLKYRN